MEYDLSGYERAGEQAIAIGWGCPLEAPLSNMAASGGVQWLGWINYFIPIGDFAAMLIIWLVAIGAYYVASIVLRWMKAVS